MLCRHNRYVQEYGRLRDPDEVSRRERLWEQVLARIERGTGHEAGAIPPEDFRVLLAEQLELPSFRARRMSRSRSHA